MRIRNCLSVRGFETVVAVASNLCDDADDGFYIFVLSNRSKMSIQKKNEVITNSNCMALLLYSH